MNNSQINQLSIVLPVINERPNLENLIPELLRVCDVLGIESEVIVSDDSSDDGTCQYIETYNLSDSRVRLVNRSGQPCSLPESINDGVLSSKFEYILWMDADGSMSPSVITDLIASFDNFGSSRETIVVGSRFVKGGGFKGADSSGRTRLLQAHRNLRATNDSFIAMVLSRILNRYLWITLGRCCKDPASGFVLARRTFLLTNRLVGSYGDYCPRLLFSAKKLGVQIIEVPYICLPRKFGVSKTGVTLFQLIKRGMPYATLPIRIRISNRLAKANTIFSK
jgi:dolichol-phosphate mannosyltransferase